MATMDKGAPERTKLRSRVCDDVDVHKLVDGTGALASRWLAVSDEL